MLIGTCQNEFVNGCDNPEAATLTEADLKKRMEEAHGASSNKIIEAYRREYPQESPFGLWAAISASAPRQNSITQAERKAAQGAASAYHYLYAWRTPMLDNTPGTFHSSEITFAFDNADLCTQYSGGSQEALSLSYKMGETWASFARTGRPGHKKLPEWPAYNRESRATMVFNNQCAVKNDIEGAGLRLMKEA
jgi:para-nitrobenzyl esterase